MLIVLEGPDGAGKSTLARKIADEIGAEVWHRGPPTSHPLDEYETPLFGYRPGSGQHIVCDRWHVGEWVYPEVLGRETTVTPTIFRHIELFLRSRGALLVPLMNLEYVLAERLRERGDDLIETSQLGEICRRYSDVYGCSILATSSARSAVADAQALERRYAMIHSHGSYIGARTPKILLIGERREFEAPYPPAFGPYPATCGRWMLDAIEETDVPIDRYGFANAYEEDLHALWDSLNKPRVVALGVRAHDELTKSWVPHGAVPHPQYVRRFHHRETLWYVNQIEKAAWNEENLLKCRP